MSSTWRSSAALSHLSVRRPDLASHAPTSNDSSPDFASANGKIIAGTVLDVADAYSARKYAFGADDADVVDDDYHQRTLPWVDRSSVRVGLAPPFVLQSETRLLGLALSVPLLALLLFLSLRIELRRRGAGLARPLPGGVERAEGNAGRLPPSGTARHALAGLSPGLMRKPGGRCFGCRRGGAEAL